MSTKVPFFKIRLIDYNKLENGLVSIILCTFREKPKFELLYQSLSHQTIKNFELVIADYLYAKRKDYIKKLAKKYKIPLANMPNILIKLAFREKIPEGPKYNILPKNLYWIRHIDCSEHLIEEKDLH